MRGIVVVLLAVLLFVPGALAAEDRKLVPEAPVAATAKKLPQKLDLNRVSREELVGVPGIGPRMAQAIVDLRTKKGAFRKVEDLLEVSGIKEKKLASITGYLEVLAPAAPAGSSPAIPSR